MTEDGRCDWSGGSRGSDMWSVSRNIMKLKIIVFAGESIVRCKGREASKVEERYQEQHFKIFGQEPVRMAYVAHSTCILYNIYRTYVKYTHIHSAQYRLGTRYVYVCNK